MSIPESGWVWNKAKSDVAFCEGIKKAKWAFGSNDDPYLEAEKGRSGNFKVSEVFQTRGGALHALYKYLREQAQKAHQTATRADVKADKVKAKLEKNP